MPKTTKTRANWTGEQWRVELLGRVVKAVNRHLRTWRREYGPALCRPTSSDEVAGFMVYHFSATMLDLDEGIDLGLDDTAMFALQLMRDRHFRSCPPEAGPEREAALIRYDDDRLLETIRAACARRVRARRRAA